MAENVKKGNSGKKVAIIVGSIVGVLVIGAIVFFIFFFNSTKKLECTASNGNLTIMYNDKDLVGYTTVNYKFELDEQSEIAQKIGVEAYLTEFETWWKTNTGGTCVRK